jgi:glycosyltransferase involved in cell wall biosynthesis
MMEDKISVVIPVYNAIQYLEDCVKSVTCQDYSKIEIVIVDDGSTDGSGELCDRLATTDERIVVVHKQNGGVTAARKTGVDKATGTWISFVDADDLLKEHALSDMYEISSGTDIVYAFINQPSEKRALDLCGCRKAMILGDYIPVGPYAKLFKKTLLSSFVFDLPRDLVVAEDWVMNVRIIFAASREPHILYKSVYYYRDNLSSTMHSFKSSLKHVEMFKKCLLLSIPEELQKYYENSIYHRLCYDLVNLSKNTPASFQNSPYIKQLREEIKEKNIKFTFLEKSFLNSNNPLMVYVLGRLLGRLKRLSKK